MSAAAYAEQLARCAPLRLPLEPPRYLHGLAQADWPEPALRIGLRVGDAPAELELDAAATTQLLAAALPEAERWHDLPQALQEAALACVLDPVLGVWEQAWGTAVRIDHLTMTPASGGPDAALTDTADGAGVLLVAAIGGAHDPLGRVGLRLHERLTGSLLQSLQRLPLRDDCPVAATLTLGTLPLAVDALGTLGGDDLILTGWTALPAPVLVLDDGHWTLQQDDPADMHSVALVDWHPGADARAGGVCLDYAPVPLDAATAAALHPGSRLHVGQSLGGPLRVTHDGDVLVLAQAMEIDEQVVLRVLGAGQDAHG